MADYAVNERRKNENERLLADERGEFDEINVSAQSVTAPTAQHEHAVDKSTMNILLANYIFGEYNLQNNNNKW